MISSVCVFRHCVPPATATQPDGHPQSLRSSSISLSLANVTGGGRSSPMTAATTIARVRSDQTIAFFFILVPFFSGGHSLRRYRERRFGGSAALSENGEE